MPANKTVCYFVSDKRKKFSPLDAYSSHPESFVWAVNTMANKMGAPNLLQNSLLDCYKDHLASGMEVEFYELNTQYFRVTIEEVDKEGNPK
jgi:hypothetical protein